jgi:methionyl-tRNA formyltransferase
MRFAVDARFAVDVRFAVVVIPSLLSATRRIIGVVIRSDRWREWREQHAVPALRRVLPMRNLRVQQHIVW